MLHQRPTELGAALCSSRCWLADDARLVIGALDSLGAALAEHYHQWSVGEREIYEQSVTLLEKAIASSCDCMEPDSLASGIFPLPKPCSEQHLPCVQSSVQSLVSECSPWRVASLALLRLASMPCRCFVWICSWCLSWVGRFTFQRTNMYSAAEIGPKRDILECDNAAGLRHYHGVLGYIPF